MFFLPFNVPSSKNSKPNGIYFSPPVRKYLQKIGVQGYSPGKRYVKEYKTRPNLFREVMGPQFQDIEEWPIILGFHFVRDSKRKADFHNLCHIVLDLLTAHEFIPDDNMDYIIPQPIIVNGGWYSVKKAKPGVFMKFLNELEYVNNTVKEEYV